MRISKKRTCKECYYETEIVGDTCPLGAKVERDGFKAAKPIDKCYKPITLNQYHLIQEDFQYHVDHMYIANN